MKRSKWTKWSALTLAVVMMLTVLAACSKDSGDTDGEKRLLRIATLYGSGNNEHLRSTYTDLYAFANPNIEIEFVSAVDWNKHYFTNENYENPNQEPDAVEEMTKLLEGDNPPDLLFVDQNSLQQFVENNLLQSLEPFIQDNEFDLEDFVPVVKDSLREAGNGEMYALAPTFSSAALIYNLDIFTEAGVSPPTDKMTWDEIFDLAQRISAHYATADEKKYGFAFTQWSNSRNLFEDMRSYTSSLGLQVYDPEANTMLVDSPEWEQVWTKMIQLKEANIFPEEPDYEKMTEQQMRSRYYSHNFLSGRTAMMLMDYGQINEIITAMTYANEMDDFEPFTWDFVTYPVHPDQPDTGGFASLDPIMAIPAKAQNTEDAWEMIAFINGEEWAKLKSKSTYNMVSRKSYIEEPAGYDINLEAFYTLKTGPNPYLADYRNNRYWEVSSFAYDLFNRASNGEMTVKEALQEWTARGNEMLQRPQGDNGFGIPIDGAVTESEATIEVIE
ncbi:ABC transporter substrate-binding protein [Marinicrinis sediminis]|uniref:ABC transporter substrate-binding protein n=1 Tax=Marinicrinis sediminis TaxID=1652465 RepID=A0ABW5RCC4_9BACL